MDKNEFEGALIAVPPLLWYYTAMGKQEVIDIMSSSKPETMFPMIRLHTTTFE